MNEMNRQTALQRVASWLPGLRLLIAYDRSFWRHDLTAGLVVTLVLIPSAVAYADLAKCPPIAGLYAALGRELLPEVIGGRDSIRAKPSSPRMTYWQ
jgi:SulP family sulfate permease